MIENIIHFTGILETIARGYVIFILRGLLFEGLEIVTCLAFLMKRIEIKMSANSV